MKIGYFIKKQALKGEARIETLLSELSAGGASIYEILTRECVQPNTDMVLSFGGDGTFLSAAHRVSEAGIPILGVNFGRMGFLAANFAEVTAEAVLSGRWSVEELDMLQVSCYGVDIPDYWPYAVNELSLHRSNGAIVSRRVSRHKLQFHGIGVLCLLENFGKLFSCTILRKIHHHRLGSGRHHFGGFRLRRRFGFLLIAGGKHHRGRKYRHCGSQLHLIKHSAFLFSF